MSRPSITWIVLLLEGVFEKAAGMVSTISKFKASNFLKIDGKDVALSSMAGDHLVGILLDPA